jgi:hypothetical protein
MYMETVSLPKIEEDGALHNHRCENLKSRKSFDRLGERA